MKIIITFLYPCGSLDSTNESKILTASAIISRRDIKDFETPPYPLSHSVVVHIPFGGRPPNNENMIKLLAFAFTK